MSAYLSKEYVNVVLGDGVYKGYRTIYVGDRAMVFQHPEKDEIRCYSKEDDWMKSCWESFLEKVNELG